MPMHQKLIQLNPIVTFLAFLDTHLLIPVIALYATSLGADIGTLGLVVGVYYITNIITNIIGGRWIDKFGCKAPLIIGLCGDALAMIAYGILFPAVSALLIDHTTPEEYGIATGIFHALITIGVAVGAPVMGWIAQYTGLKVGLAVLFIIFLPALILTMVKLKQERGSSIAN